MERSRFRAHGQTGQRHRHRLRQRGTGSNSILYRNFQVLKTVTGADAVNFDDESAYDLSPTTQFGQLLIGLGYKITFAPYTNQSFWRSFKNNLGSAVDTIYLQVHDGGVGNNPASWKPRSPARSRPSGAARAPGSSRWTTTGWRACPRCSPRACCPSCARSRATRARAVFRGRAVETVPLAGGGLDVDTEEDVRALKRRNES